MMSTMDPTPIGSGAEGGTPVAVLAVLDAGADARALAAALPQARYDLHVVRDDAALERALARLRWDVVLVDRQHDTIAMVRRLRADQRAGDVPVLILAARAEAVDVMAGIECGANDCVASAHDAVVLQARIELHARTQGAVRLRGDQVVALACHDVRSPVATMVRYAELLLRGINGDTPPRLRESLELIAREGRHALELLRDATDLAAVEAGSASLALSRVDVEELLQEVVESHVPLARAKEVTLVAPTGPTGPAVIADRTKFARVLDSLVANAVNYCLRGDRVTAEVIATTDSVQVRVSDTGPGIPAARLPHIFERNPRSTGLGLHIAHGLVRLHGGTLTVESIEGHGSTFTASLPRHSGPGELDPLED